jgi:GNAT superfamily N-acetyltransferase
MTSFKEYLQEFRSNASQGQMVDRDQLAEWVKTATLLKFVILIRENNNTEKDIAVFEYSEFGLHDKFIILTARKNRSDIVGYAWLNSSISNGVYWQVKDVALFPQYRGKGVGTNLYIKLAKEGYNLMNGYSLSKEAEKVWRKLPKFVNVYTWDKETNELSSMDEKPKQDSKWDDDQRYFWVAQAKPGELKESQWHANDDHWFLTWLNGRTAPSFGSEWFEGNY